MNLPDYLVRGMVGVFATAALLMSGIAAAISPTGPYTAVSDGTATLTNGAGTTISCEVTFEGEVDSSGNFFEVTNASFSPGDSLCLFVSATNFPWTGTVNSAATEVTIDDVHLQALGQPDCGPASITASWQNGSQTQPGILTFDHDVLGDCVAETGTLEATNDATGEGLRHP